MIQSANSASASNTPRILVVDDEAHIRELLEITLIKMGMDVDCAESLSMAKNRFAKQNYSLVLTDMRLPDGLGLELVEEVVKSNKNTPIAVITAFGSADNAVEALKAGAFDYVSKPIALDQLRKLVSAALQVNQLQISLAGQVKSRSRQYANSNSRLTGQSFEVQELRNQLVRLARSMAPVAVCGESGSGKELVAREIHAQSPRANKPFIAVNCGAIPEALMEAEFFGYRKGAFTGANEDRDGFFQAAAGGTLMLDEVAELPLAMQVKLLRAIQERAVRKVGATSEEGVDVRIISATHQNLEECVTNKRFRRDLYYRLNVIELRVPSLRERRDDIAELSESILHRLAGKPMVLSAEALHALRQYDFPGNVRELENILERALAFANEGVIELSDLALKSNKPEPMTVLPVLDANISLEVSQERAEYVVETPDISYIEVAGEIAKSVEQICIPTGLGGHNQYQNTFLANADLPTSLPTYLEQVEREIIVRALQKTRNNKTQAAELLGMTFRQLRYQIQKLKIEETE